MKAVVTNAGVYDFEPASKRMRIKSLHAGVSAGLAQMATDWENIFSLPQGVAGNFRPNASL